MKTLKFTVFIFIMHRCVHIYPLTHIQLHVCWHPERPEEGVRSLRGGATQHGNWKPNSGPLQEKQLVALNC